MLEDIKKELINRCENGGFLSVEDIEYVFSTAVAPANPAQGGFGEPEAWLVGGSTVSSHKGYVEACAKKGLSVEPLHAANPAQVTDAAEALKPFTTFAEEAVERSDNLWVWKSNIFRDRVCDWFGPSDFGLLIHFSKALAAIGAGGQAVAWLACCSDGKMVHTIKSRLVEDADSLYGKNQWTLTPLYAQPADERVVEALATVEEWQKWALTWAGSAFLSGESLSPDDMTEAEHKSELYSGMCKLSNHMVWLRDEIAALSAKEGQS